MNVWYHRHFKEVAEKRYAKDEAASKLHRNMADYFLGLWSDRPKPLELFKGKKGNYEDCSRGVPAQPLTFEGTCFVVAVRWNQMRCVYAQNVLIFNVLNCT